MTSLFNNRVPRARGEDRSMPESHARPLVQLRHDLTALSDAYAKAQEISAECFLQCGCATVALCEARISAVSEGSLTPVLNNRKAEPYPLHKQARLIAVRVIKMAY